MRTADFDDTYRIYSEKGELMVRLLAAISRIADHDNVDLLADAVIYLLDSYNSLIFDYARMGVALLATQMIRSKIQTNLFKGL